VPNYKPGHQKDLSGCVSAGVENHRTFKQNDWGIVRTWEQSTNGWLVEHIQSDFAVMLTKGNTTPLTIFNRSNGVSAFFDFYLITTLAGATIRSKVRRNQNEHGQ